MADFLIDGIDDVLMAGLEKTASEHGMPVEEYARAILEADARRDPEFFSPSRSDGEGDRPKGGGGGTSEEDMRG